MIRIDADKYLLELTFKSVNKEDGNEWWNYDVYLFDKEINKIKYSTKDNIFHDSFYNHMDLHFQYDILNFAYFLKKILGNINEVVKYESCEQEIGFIYTPTNFKKFEFDFRLFEQRLWDEELIFHKTFNKQELEELKKQFYFEYEQHIHRNKVTIWERRIDLSSDGIVGNIWNFSECFEVLKVLKKDNILILGGDVLICKDGQYGREGSSWHYDGDSYLDSIEVAYKYLGRLSDIKNNMAIDFIFNKYEV